MIVHFAFCGYCGLIINCSIGKFYKSIQGRKFNQECDSNSEALQIVFCHFVVLKFKLKTTMYEPKPLCSLKSFWRFITTLLGLINNEYFFIGKKIEKIREFYLSNLGSYCSFNGRFKRGKVRWFEISRLAKYAGLEKRSKLDLLTLR